MKNAFSRLIFVILAARPLPIRAASAVEVRAAPLEVGRSFSAAAVEPSLPQTFPNSLPQMESLRPTGNFSAAPTDAKSLAIQRRILPFVGDKPLANPAGWTVQGNLSPAAGRYFDGAKAAENLKRAWGSYTVDVLRRIEDDEAYFAVILGESHIKNNHEAILGKGIVSKFVHYAIEGYDKSSTLGRRLNTRVLSAQRKQMARKNPEKYGRGSTIDVAFKRVNGRMAARQFLIEQAPLARTILREAAAEAVASNRPKRLQLRFEGVPIMNSPEILRILGAIEKGTLSRRQTIPCALSAVKLEENHRSDWMERIEVWWPTVLPATLYGPWIAALSGAAGGLSGHLKIAEFCVAVTLTLAAGVRYLNWAERRARSRFGLLHKYLFPFQFGAIRARDKTMATNLAKAARSTLGGSPVLAIVGMAHSEGIRNHLIETHGFESVGLNALDSVSTHRLISPDKKSELLK